MTCAAAAGSVASESIHRGPLTRFLARPRWQGIDFNAPLRRALLDHEARRAEGKPGRYLFIIDATLVSQAGTKTQNTHSTGNRVRRPRKGRRYNQEKVARKSCHSFTFGLKEVDEALGLFDGGPWIDNQMRKQQIPLTDKCLDFYHLRDNIQKTRREIFGTLEDGDEVGKAWAHDLAETFKTQGFTAGFDALVTFRNTQRSPKKKQAATRLVNYISDRRALITYPEFRAAGRDIGSGPTEAQCQCLTLRIKGHGRRWNTANALAISTIEAVHQSRLTEKFWNRQCA